MSLTIVLFITYCESICILDGLCRCSICLFNLNSIPNPNSNPMPYSNSNFYQSLSISTFIDLFIFASPNVFTLFYVYLPTSMLSIYMHISMNTYLWLYISIYVYHLLSLSIAVYQRSVVFPIRESDSFYCGQCWANLGVIIGLRLAYSYLQGAYFFTLMLNWKSKVNKFTALIVCVYVKYSLT